MKRALSQLTDFHKAMSQTIGDLTAPDATADLGFRVRFIAEEFVELLKALAPGIEVPPLEALVERWIQRAVESRMSGVLPIEATTPDLPNVLDALCDMIYVIVGAAVTWGLPLPEAWTEVHAANMLKTTGEVRADGKRLKPIGFQPPNIAAVIRGAKLGIAQMALQREFLARSRSEAGNRRDCNALDRYERAIDVLDMKLRRLGFTPDGRPRHLDQDEVEFDRVYGLVLEQVYKLKDNPRLPPAPVDYDADEDRRSKFIYTELVLEEATKDEQEAVTRQMIEAAMEEAEMRPYSGPCWFRPEEA